MADRDEVFLQGVRIVASGFRFQFRYVITGFVIAPIYAVTEEKDRVEHVFATPVAAWSLGVGPDEVAHDWVGVIQRHQAGWGRRCPFGLPPGDGVDSAVVRRVHIAVMQYRQRVVADVGAEVRGIVGACQLPIGAFDGRVVGEVEFGFDDDTDRAVAADRGEEDVRVLGPAGPQHAAVRQHHVDVANGKNGRSEADIAPVGIDA